MHPLLEQASQFLQNVSDIPFELKAEKEIMVEPQSSTGYPVKLVIVDELLFELYLGGWYKEFTTTDAEETLEAMNYFKLALTRNFRIKEFSRGTTPYKWLLEYKTPEGWQQDSATSKLNLKMWKGRHTKYLQNDWFQLQ